MASVAGNDTHLIAAPWTGMGARHWLIRRATFRAQKKVSVVFFLLLFTVYWLLYLCPSSLLFPAPCPLPISASVSGPDHAFTLPLAPARTNH